MPKVTIGLPVYNGSASIEKVLDSLLCQTLADFEIYISDNASTDNTEQICRYYESVDSRIKYHRQTENIGPMKNFSFVLEQARGDYFLFAASDDLRSSDFLEVNASFLDENPLYVASTCPNWFEDQTMADAVNFAVGGRIEERFVTFFQNCWHSHGVFYSMVRLKILRECKFLSSNFLAIDWAIILFLLSQGPINRTKSGYIIFSRGGASQQVAAYKSAQNEKLEMFIPFLHFGVYAWKLGRSLSMSKRLWLFFALARLNLRAVKEKFISALYQFYKRNFRNFYHHFFL